MDFDGFESLYESLSESQMIITGMSGNRIEGRISTTEDGKALLLTIPYSDDVKVYIDGNRADSCTYAGALLMVPGISAGEHTIFIEL